MSTTPAVKFFVDTEQLGKDVSINPSDLDTAMIEQSSLFVHYAEQAAKAQNQADNLKMVLEVREAQIDKELRDAAAENGEKVTEAMLNKAIVRDPRYVKALKAYNEAKMIADLAKNACEAFKHRRDMLIQLGNKAREEMKGELRIQAAEAQEEASRAKRARIAEMLRAS